ncbi:MAG: cupin domain-containing protein [Alphaproteobacteria bacterium]|nr:cupin domain-containing protein [Alphaproteobacteria bacterium]
MSSFHNIDDIPDHNEEIGTLKILSGSQSMVLWGKIDAGSHVPNHSHPNEQITWLVKGSLDYKLSTGEERKCEEGTVIVIPGGVDHEVWYREDCEIVEFFSPPRNDMFPVSTDNPYGV